MTLRRMWENARLQGKFLMIAIPLIVLITSTLFYYTHFTASERERVRLYDRIEQIAKIESQSLSGLVWSFNVPQIELFMSAIINDPDIVGAQVTDDTGRVLGESGDLTSDAGNLFERLSPIEFKPANAEDAQLIGQLRLVYSTERLQTDAQRQFWTNLVTISILTLSVILSALAALLFAVRHPLDKFLLKIRSDQSERMSGKANETEVGQFDEVRTVVQAYDNLRTQQKAYERELTEIKEGLEQSVEERTRDLRFEKERVEEALEDLTRTQARLVQSEKMASLGQLTAGIAHEIKNPLNFVNNFASLSNDLLSELEAGLKDEVSRLSKEDREDIEDLLATLSSNLQKINHHGRRADSIVKNMLSHSRDESGAISEVNINSAVEEAIGLVYHAARAEKADFNITIEREFSEKIPPVACYLQEISRVLINIMSNGMYAANKRHQDAGSGVEPRLVVRTEFENESCVIKIEDNGDGIPVEDREKIFEPFYTTKPAGDGTGLGLSLSFEIVETQHGGHLTVDSKVGDYTCFTISIPVAVDGADTSERVS